MIIDYSILEIMSKGPIGIIGYGELGKQLELLALGCGWKGEFIYFDDRDPGQKHWRPFQDFRKAEFRHLNFLVGIGYKNLRLRSEIFDCLAEKKRTIPSLIHPTAFIHPSVTLGAGVYIYPLCNVDKNVVLETGVILNNSVVVSHDSVVAQASFLAPGVILSGFCRVGACTFLGAGSVVSNQVSIGAQVTVGIGSVVSRNLASGKCYIGNPIREVAFIELT